jgi:hypothetical protein
LQQYRLARFEAQRYWSEQRRSIGQRHVDILHVDDVLRRRFRARAKDCCGFPLYLGRKLGQPVHGRPPLGNAGIAADEPGQRLVEALKCICGLDQPAELDRAGEISGRGDQQRKERGTLAE